MSVDATASLRSGVTQALAAAGLVATRLEVVRRDGSLWRASVGEQDLLVRRVDRRDAAATAATAVWLNRLTQAGILVPRPHRIPLIPMGRHALFVTLWRRGTPIADVGWDASGASALGGLLARCHALPPGEPIAGARRYDAAWAAGLTLRLERTAALLHADAGDVERVRAGLARARASLDAAWRGGRGGPIRMVHADVHMGNVIDVEPSPGRRVLALIDAGRVGLAPVMLDVAFALLDHDPPTAWALMRAYRRHRPITDDDLHALGAFHPLAIADNLAFLTDFPEERPHVERIWATLIATCVAAASGAPTITVAAAS